MTSQPRTPAWEQAIRANGLTFAVTTYDGDGPPLVLLHGIGSRAVSWWPVVDGLAARFRLHALDLRGHGRSDKPPAGYLLPDYAGDLAALLDALGLEQPRILGHSLGGLVALSWAVNNAERAAAIALEDTALRGTREILDGFDGWLALSALPVEQVAAYYRSEYPGWTEEDCRRRAESITSTARGVFAELRADSATNLATGHDRLGHLSAIRSPVLLVRGDPAAGSMVVPDDAARLAADLPNARIARVPGAGHNIHRDRPEEFLAAVMPFLEGER